MDKVANSKRKMVENLMTKLGNVNSFKVYLCKDGENVEIPEPEYGHFFQDNVYAVDVKGSNHRYIVQWFGPRLPSDQVSAHRAYMDKLTDYVLEPKMISRVSVMQGHEDDTLLKFFPNGFICHDGPYTDLAAQQAKLAGSGALYRI